MTTTEIRVRGTTTKVPCIHTNDKTVIVTGGWLKVASVKDEGFQEGDVVTMADQLIAVLQGNKDLKADLLTFSEKLTNPTPRLSFRYELESVAAIRVSSFADWWANRVSTYLRRDVRRAQKRGVSVRPTQFDDDFVRGVMDIYNETPVRQGRHFWHYHKSFEAVKLETGTYLERSDFLGAFINEQLIGFLKIVYVDHVACLMQIIAKEACTDAMPMNALIAKAVELCDAKGCSHLTYGKYRYAQGADSVTAFKHRNGFDEILVPKYYVPLTIKGRLALCMGLHRGARALVPAGVQQTLRGIRAALYRYSCWHRGSADREKTGLLHHSATL